MLFAIRHYTLPLLMALVLHGAAVWMLYRGWHPEKETLNVITPRTVVANLVVLEAKAKPAPARPKAPPPKPAPTQSKPKPDPAKDKARELEAQKAKELAAQKAAQQKREAQEKQRQQELARQERLARLSELANSSFEQALEEESQDLHAGTEEMVAQSYRAGIYELVRQNWSRPPSARNGMQAKLLVELIPTGEVVAVTVEESSGSAAFDRSAEQAVRRARRFDVPPENELFERYFRRFYFLFQPEDLLR